MKLYLTYDNSTLDFQSNGYKVVDGFYPETPENGADSVVDQFNVLIKANPGDELHEKVTGIRLALEHAQRHSNDSHAAHLYFEIDKSNDAWMSKIIKGSILYDSNLSRNWRHGAVIATVMIEHKPYWDAVDEVQIPLSNGNGSDDISGLAVYNHDDAGTSPAHDNWVEISAADVLGDLPGPTRLEITNTFATARLGTLWIGQNWTDPANFIHILEGESSSTGTQESDNGCSGALYRKYALSSGAECDMFTWSLSDSFLNACQGQYYKFLARFLSGDPPNVKFRIKLQYNAITVWQSGQVILDQSRALQIRDMFTLRLPPWLLGQTGLSALSMIMAGQQSTGSSINVNLDFLQVTPLDGWRMLECAGYGINQNERLIDDGVNENCYIDNGSGSNKIGDFIGYGNPIALYPGKKQRLYFLMHTTSGDVAEILRTISVKLYYHPRRQTL